MITTRKNLFGRRGFTLIDLMIALSVTVMIGGTVAAMIRAVAMGTTGSQDGRRHLVRLQGLQAQLNDVLRTSRCVLAAGNGYLVYWSNDNNGDMNIQLSEMEIIELDTTTNQLKRTTFVPQSLAQDFLYASNSVWYSTAEAAKGTTSAVTAIMAANVTQFNVTLDSSGSPAHMVNMTITLTDQGESRSGTVACAMRSYVVPQ